MSLGEPDVLARHGIKDPEVIRLEASSFPHLATRVTPIPAHEELKLKCTKHANPKQAYGDKKVPLQNIPPVALAYMGMALKEGARKYGAYNWRENDVELMTYAGAAMRHIACWIDREDIDVESGNPHIAHALASLAILVDAVECRCAIDNRPPEGGAPRVLMEAADAAK